MFAVKIVKDDFETIDLFKTLEEARRTYEEFGLEGWTDAKTLYKIVRSEEDKDGYLGRLVVIETESNF